MKIIINKNPKNCKGKRWRVCLDDLPGSPPVGIGNTLKEAMADLLVYVILMARNGSSLNYYGDCLNKIDINNIEIVNGLC